MCSYSNFSQLIGRLLVQESQQSLSLRKQAYHPWTCTYVRLLGPCFKTGRREPFSHHHNVREPPKWFWSRHAKFGPPLGPTKNIRHPAGRLPCSWSFPQERTNVDAQGKKHHRQSDQNQQPHLRKSYQPSPMHATISPSGLVPFASLSAISGTFNSLFKVLFTFPSWYLFAIGLKPIFSFRWNLPPNLRSSSEERDSEKACRTQGTTDETQDSHPRWCSFPRGLHLRLCWQYLSRLQFKARGPNFHAELIPVHSPLLRESYLVSFPPLTYMLKFSGFADLTSCLKKAPRAG